MKVDRTKLPGVLLLEPEVYRDDRGFFYESFNSDVFAALAADGLPGSFVQDNHSRSTERVLRGLHYQLHRPQGKLVTCVRGTIFDVAVDIRVGSPTFGRWTGVTLNGDAPRCVWIPAGFAHGYCVLSPVADVTYKCTERYVPGDEHGVLWSDERIGITWPLRDPITSPKDRALLGLDANRKDLPRYSP